MKKNTQQLSARHPFVVLLFVLKNTQQLSARHPFVVLLFVIKNTQQLSARHPFVVLLFVLKNTQQLSARHPFVVLLFVLKNTQQLSARHPFVVLLFVLKNTQQLSARHPFVVLLFVLKNTQQLSARHPFVVLLFVIKNTQQLSARHPFVVLLFVLKNTQQLSARHPFVVLLFVIKNTQQLSARHPFVVLLFVIIIQKMSLGILTSTLQALKGLKDHDYVRRLQDFTRDMNIYSEGDYSHVTARKSRGQMIRMSAAVCGIELCYAAETAFVSPILLKLGVPVAFMTLVWCVSPLLGFFLVPIMGSLSDRCPLKLGRRRPFILIFSAGIVVGLILVPNGESLGMLAGDTDGDYDYSQSPINGTATLIKKLNDTDDLVQLQNGTTQILRSSFSPAWPSAVKLPDKHVTGILLTILGVALLDFNCDACQSPCRTYLLDISVPEDHSRGLTSFTVMAGMGGCFGYLMGGINWEATSFGTALGGHVRVVFTCVLVLFIVCVILTITSFKEIPLAQLGKTNKQSQKKIKRVKKAKYRKFVNESSSEDESRNSEKEQVNDKSKSYGSLSKQVQNGVIHSINQNDSSAETNDLHKEAKINLGDSSEYARSDITNSIDFQKLLDDVSLKTYLRSIVKMPRSLLILCLTNLFCWMSLVCYSLYFTDFVGQSVYGGDPKAPVGSSEHDLYDQGVRLGSFGMSLYSLSCAVYSMCVEYIVERFGARPVYICGQLVYTVGMIVLALSRHPATVILMSPCAGIMYATLFTMPYLIVAHYHSSGRFSQTDEKMTSDIRGLGTDVALVSSMVFLAQFLLSLFMGSLVHLVGSTVTIVIAAALLSFCGAVCATQVTYLDL